jgi:PAS domain S-box-containing protein
MLRLIAGGTRALEACEDRAGILQAAVELPVPEVADISILVLRDGAGWDRLADVSVLVRHRAPAEAPGIEAALRERLPQVVSVARRLSRRGATVHGLWLPIVDAHARRRIGGDGADEVLALANRLHLAALVAAPIGGPSGPHGVLCWARIAPAERYSALVYAAARSVAGRITVALDNTRLRDIIAIEGAQRTQMEASTQKWAHAFEHAPYGAAIVDTSGRIENVNPAFARLYRYPARTDLQGVRLSQLQADGVVHSVKPEPHEGAILEATQRRADGSTFPALLSDTALRGPDGTLLSRVVTVQDLTILRRTEEQLRHAQRLESVGRLAGGVAHEVNNMMTVVLGFADLLAQATGLTDEHREDVRHVAEAAERASSISRQLLAFGRQQILRPSLLNINPLVDRVATLLRPLLAGTTEIALDLGDLGGYGAYADPGQLQQVLINLALNARDAMPDGGTIRFTTSCGPVPPDVSSYHLGFEVPPGLYVLLTVSDSGVGMDAETLAHAFDPFFTTKPVGQGTGLGLATVYGIVKQSGGYVWADSDPGRGTSIIVCLPAVRLENLTSGEDVTAEIRKGCARLLVVDDEPGVRQLTVRMLARLGYRVTDAGDAAEALRAISQDKPDLVLADVVMPGLNGRELREQIRDIDPELPVVLMSVHPASGRQRQEPTGPGEYWLEKPFSLAALAARLHEALAQRVPEL